MTFEQLETLRVAQEKGYFEVPRETTLVDVAEELDRPDVDVSRQLRQGIDTVLRETDLL